MSKKFGEDWWKQEKNKWVEGNIEEGEREGPPPDSEIERAFSQEYLEFKDKERRENRSLYIKACRSAGRLFKIPPGQDTKVRLKNAMRLLDWNIDPGSCVSLSLMVTLGLVFVSLGVLLFTPLEMVFKLAFLIVPLGSLYYLMFYPIFEVKEKIIKSSEDLVFSILYMIVYVHSSPNLERAVKFAALNLTGPISEDLKKVLWDVDTGKYKSLETSLEHYTSRWKPYNRDYLQALQLIRTAISTVSIERRKKLLNEASNTILEGTKEKMKHYSQSLKMPVMILNGLGIMLPILGMIALPITSIFMGGAVKPMYLIVVYDLVIPGTVYIIMKKVLSQRPPTTSVKPLRKGILPSKGRYTIGSGDSKVEMPVILPAILIFFVFGYWGITYYASLPNLSSEPSLWSIGRSLLLIIGIAFSIGFYYYFGYKQRLKKQKEIQEMESEFSEALFELGHRLGEGTPIEIALDSSAESMADLEISSFFKRISRNIKETGMTFRQAVFDNKYGAIAFFPSKLIQTVMRTIVQASKKGTEVTSKTMIIVSRYLQNLHLTQEEINDLMEETTSTMQFVGYILAPVVAGVAVSMAQIMGKALKILSEQFGQLGSFGGELGGETGPGLQSIKGIINIQANIPPDILQLIVGVYIIEMLYIIGLFYTRIQTGENEALEKTSIGKLLFVGIIVYSLVTVIISLAFGGLLSNIALNV